MVRSRQWVEPAAVQPVVMGSAAIEDLKTLEEIKTAFM